MRYFLVLLVFLSGCASVIDGTLESAESITFTSTPTEANVFTNGVKLCVTPCRVRVYRWGIKNLLIQKDGFHAAQVDAQKSGNVSIFGNIIFGGGIGVVLDTLTGRITVSADAVHAELKSL